MTHSKVLCYGHGGSANHGCEAIVRGTRRILHDRDLVVVSARPSEDAIYALGQICTIVDAGQARKNGRTVGSVLRSVYRRVTGDTTPYFRHAYPNLSAYAPRHSVALSIGGDNYCYGSFPKTLAGFNKMLVQQGVRTVLWGCSIEPDLLKDEEIRRDMKRYALITARESITYAALQDAGIRANTKLFPDPAFTLEAAETPLPDGFVEGNTIGLNLSPLVQRLDGGGDLAYQNCRALIKHLIDSTNLQVALVPHVVSDKGDDREPLGRLHKEFGASGRVILVSDRDCMELKGLISRCRMFIGARTHSTIAAYSRCVPTLVLGYSVKARGIARDIFGTDKDYVLPVQSLESENDLVNAFKWLSEREDEIRAHLRSFMPGYVTRAKLAGDEIRNLQAR